MNGCLVLRAGLLEGRTVLLESKGTYPLQVTRAQSTHDGRELSLVMVHLAGGLLDGDEISIDVNVEPGARLALRTQAATQAHAGKSRQTVHATVGETGWFSYVPHALVPHADADHHLQTVIHMASDARVLVADALTPGRVGYDEVFDYAQVRLDLDVWRGADLLARDRAVVRPDPTMRSAQFGPFTHTAGVYVLGPSEVPCAEEDGPVRLGRTQLAYGGWYVRAMAQRAADLDQVLQRLSAGWWRSCEVPNPGCSKLGDLPAGSPPSQAAHF